MVLMLDATGQAAVTENLLDRLADCRRVFSTVAVVGGACSSVVKQLAAAENGGSQVLVLDESSAMLEHTRRLEQLQVGDCCQGTLQLTTRSRNDTYAAKLRSQNQDVQQHLLLSCLEIDALVHRLQRT